MLSHSNSNKNHESCWFLRFLIRFSWFAVGVSASSNSWQPTTATTTALPSTPLFSSIQDHNLPQLHNLFHRRLKWKPSRWGNHHKKQQHRRSSSSSSPSNGGTRLTLRRPTPESVAKWFASLGREFNHDSVGMTNPCLHISLSPSLDEAEQHLVSSSHARPSLSDLLVSPVSTSESPPMTSNGDHVEDSWWPNTSCQEKSKQQQQQPAWKVIRYRRRIGRGQECYERVRNAALDWEFAFGPQQLQQPSEQSTTGEGGSSQQSEMGILAVHPQATSKRRSSHGHDATTTSSPWTVPTSRRDTSSYGGVHQHDDHNDHHQHRHVAALEGDVYAPLTRDAARHVLQLWSGPGGRRLVTYTGTSGNMFRIRCLPRLFAVNPVMVIYDLIDQRGPGTTYTSTAYATLKGHWLSGEERVTVALRDGVHGDVDVEILSFSRPAPTLAGKLIWPFVGRRQREFFERQLQALEQVSRRSSSSTSSSSSSDARASMTAGSSSSSGNHFDPYEPLLSPFHQPGHVLLPHVLDVVR